MNPVPVAGQIWRHTSIEPFGDHVVLRIENDQARLARPYAYASETSRQPLLGSEVYMLPIRIMREDTKHWRFIETRRTL